MDFDALRGRESELQGQIDSMLETLQQQQQDLQNAQAQVAQLRVTGESVDRLVRVTVNSVGAVQGVWFSPESLKNATPELLAKSVKEASLSAAVEAHAEMMRLMEPVMASANDFPDLPEIIPGAPSMRDFRQDLSAPTQDETSGVDSHFDDGDDDDFPRDSIMKSGW